MSQTTDTIEVSGNLGQALVHALAMWMIGHGQNASTTNQFAPQAIALTASSIKHISA
jgi:hypothetical protein